jgi:hypothetical protein
MTPRVLFVTPGFEDYLSDGILHGLRELLGAGAIDFPKQDVLYAGGSGLVRGGGFTLYGLLDDLPLDRHRALFRAEAGEFDLVVFGDIWRTFGLFTEWGPRLHGRGPRRRRSGRALPLRRLLVATAQLVGATPRPHPRDVLQARDHALDGLVSLLPAAAAAARGAQRALAAADCLLGPRGEDRRRPAQEGP